MLADGVVFQCFITQLEDGDCKRRQVQLLDRKGKGRIVRLKDGVASKSWAVEEVKCIALETGTVT